MAKKDGRFEIVLRESLGLTHYAVIIRDRVTGVLYLQTILNGASGLTPLLDGDGKPIVDLQEYE
ncbi:MAG: DUF6440 family protein [Oscillospiraceae bacterium]|nr:DUF6440 family protein [Oscillospiraceae bacterium]